MLGRLVGSARLAMAATMSLSIASSLVGSGTYAAFQAQTTNPNNVFQAGVLQIHHSKNGQVLFNVQAAPGAPTLDTSTGAYPISGVPPTGGLVPGSKITNSFTLGNGVSTLPYPMRLKATSITNQNRPVTNCNDSNDGSLDATLVTTTGNCGKARLSDYLDISIFYPAFDPDTGQSGYFCIWGVSSNWFASASSGVTGDAACGARPLTSGSAVATGDEFSPVPAESSPGTSSIDSQLATGDLIVRYWDEEAAPDSGPRAKEIWRAGVTKTVTIVASLSPALKNDIQGAKTTISLSISATSTDMPSASLPGPIPTPTP